MQTHRVAEGDRRDQGEDHAHRHDRREREEQPVRVRRHEVFLGEELQAVGQRVQQAGEADLLAEDLDDGAVGADAVLDHRALAAVGPGEDRGQVQDEHDHDQDLHDGEMSCSAFMVVSSSFRRGDGGGGGRIGGRRCPRAARGSA